ncbi:MAG: ATP-binding protein [Candidatus Sumerlaeia bacterium]|nr:ATP-binding protein [Candidatus Sumerlaeia bacterium]
MATVGTSSWRWGDMGVGSPSRIGLSAHWARVWNEFLGAWFVASLVLPILGRWEYASIGSRVFVRIPLHYIPVLCAILVVGLYVLAQSGGLRVRRPAGFFSNIPLWCPFALGVVVALLFFQLRLLVPQTSYSRYLPFGWSAVYVPSSLIVLQLLRWKPVTAACGLVWKPVSWIRRSIRHERRGSAAPAVSPQLGSEASIPQAFAHDWLKRDDPVRHPAEDLFDGKRRAVRIASELCQEKLKTIALIGDYGSGKSSILNFVEHYLAHPRDLREACRERHQHAAFPFPPDRVLCCRTSVWGMDNARSVESILTVGIERLSRETDCARIWHTPQRLSAMMEASGIPGVRMIAAALGSRRDPRELLERLDDVCRRARCRLIIFVEDADRNIEAQEVQRQLAATLSRLRDLENVSFVFAASPGSLTKDGLAKVCEHHEFLKEPNPNDLLRTILQCRDSLLSYSGKVVDPLDADDRNNIFSRLMSRLESSVYNATGNPEAGWLANHLVQVIRTPRALKYILEGSTRAWRTIEGEVDPDELIVLHTIHAVAPEIIDFISEKRDMLREAGAEFPGSDNDKPDRRKIRDELQLEWEALARGGSWQRDAHALRQLVGFLFREFQPDSAWNLRELESSDLPNAARLKIIPQNAKVILSPQGFGTPQEFGSMYRDTLQIALDEEVPQGLRDQDVLRAIAAWRQNPNSMEPEGWTLAEAVLRDAAFADRLEHFGAFRGAGCSFTLNEAKLLGEQLLEALLDPKWRTDDEPKNTTENAVLAVGRVLEAKRFPESEGAPVWITRAIERTAPADLNLACDIVNTWAGVLALKTPGFWSGFIATVERLFGDESEGFAVALKGNSSIPAYQPYLLRNLIMLKTRSEHETEFVRWDWLATMVASVGREHWEDLMPQVVCLLTDGVWDEVGFGQAWRKHFPESGDTIIAMIRVTTPKSDLPPDVLRLIENAKAWAGRQKPTDA